jgi:PAS domain-containing protein
MVIEVTGYCDYSFRNRSGQHGTSARDLVSHREVELWDSTNGYFRREPVSVPNGEEASKRAEVASLRRSEERYRSFIEQSTEGIWRFELEEPVRTHLLEDEQIEHFYRYGYLAECNDAMAKMYGFSRPQ